MIRLYNNVMKVSVYGPVMLVNCMSIKSTLTKKDPLNRRSMGLTKSNQSEIESLD
jgi:hypothetical protein